VSTSDINSTLTTALGGTYVNDFLNKGRVKKVYVQGDAQFRMLPEQIDPQSERALGDVPQAYSHLAVIDSALALAAAGVTG